MLKKLNIIVSVFQPGNRKAFLVIIHILFAIQVHGQEPAFDFKTTESKTLALYNESGWDHLISYGEEAIKAGQDYYYLRLRIGIAYFNKTNYFMAAHHLEKALQFNQNDPVLLEYLYYAYVNTKRDLEAQTLSRLFNNSLKQKTGNEKPRVIEMLAINGGYILSNNINQNKNSNQIKKWDSAYMEQSLNDDKYFVQADLGLNINKKLLLNLSYLNLNTNKLQQIRIPELTIAGKYTHVIPPGVYQGNIYEYEMVRYNLDYTMRQNSFYGSLTYNMGRGFNLSPAFHYLNIRFKDLVTTSTEESYLAQPWHTAESYKTVYDVNLRDTSFNNFIVSFNASKSFLKYNLGLTGSYSNLNGLTQYQGDLRLSWFPEGNLNFYGISRISGALEQETSKFRYLIYQSLGFKIADKLWMEIFGTLGEMVNFNEANGYVVFNSGDILKFRTGANFILPLTSNLELTLRYHFSAHQGYLETGYGLENLMVTPINYENQLFIGGISWKF